MKTKPSGIILLCVLFSLLTQHCAKDEVTAASLIGSWKITGTLITTTNPDPNAPQPGFKAMDNWQIGLNNNIPSLTSSKGTVNGTVVGKGYHFEGQYDVYPGLVWCAFVIEVTPSVNEGELYGTEEFKYYGFNGVGQPMFLGTESWTLEGEKL